MNVQIETDGITVWVTGPDGGSLARFGRGGDPPPAPSA